MVNHFRYLPVLIILFIRLQGDQHLHKRKKGCTHLTMTGNSVGLVMGAKLSLCSSNSLRRRAVCSRVLLTLYTLILWQELVTCKPQFQDVRISSGCVFKLLSQQRHTSSSQPSAFTGKSISQVRQAHLCF